MSETPAPANAARDVTRIRFGLRFKIILGLTLFNLLGTAIFAWNHYRIEREAIIQGIEKKLKVAARALPDMLPPGYMDRAVSPEGVDPEEYLQVMEKLSRYCEDTNLIYLYSYYLDSDGVFRTTSSNGTAEERASGEFAAYWEEYEEADLLRAWQTWQPVYGETDDDDQWGAVYFLFSPAVTAAGTRYIAGADVSVRYLYARLDDSLRKSILIGAASFFVVFLFSFWIGTRVSRKITQLADYTRELAAADFQPIEDLPLRQEIGEIPKRSRDEIAQLASSFIAMEERLNAYLQELTETTATKERLRNELKIAGDIQLSMLPKTFREVGTPALRSRIDLRAAVKPAKEAGGDLYDFFAIDDDHLCFVVGDVSDKGMPAALFMTVTITLLRAHATAELRERPEEILRLTNESLSLHNEMCQFVTMFLGIIHVRTGLVHFADGGHNHPFLRRTGDAARMMEFPGGIALGVMSGIAYERHSLQLQPGDALFLYSDGVTDAIAADESFYGDDRLEAELNTIDGDAPAADWVDTMMESVFRFAIDHPQADDITVLALRYLPEAPRE